MIDSIVLKIKNATETAFACGEIAAVLDSTTVSRQLPKEVCGCSFFYESTVFPAYWVDNAIGIMAAHS